MKKKEDELKKICQNLTGSLILIGANVTIQKYINDNKKITYCDFLTSVAKPSHGKSKNSELTQIPLNKMRRYYKKRNVENMLCNYEHVKNYLRRFVSISLYVTKKTIYIYGTEEEILNLMYRYSRYTKNIILKIEDKKGIMIIDSSNVKQSFFKNKFYLLQDYFIILADYISDFLVN